jgi:hypothetical protein
MIKEEEIKEDGEVKVKEVRMKIMIKVNKKTCLI